MKKVARSTKCQCITCLSRILKEYIAAAGLQSRQPLFQSVNSLGTAGTGRALNRYNAGAAIWKRAKAAGFLTPVGCHTWRATGITIYLENDGRLERASRWLGMSLRDHQAL
jgi:integrase/recombinase XerD